MMSDLESRFKELHDELRSSLRSDKHATIVSILSLHDDSAGQWIIGDPKQDPAKVATRLRVCAAVLDRQAQARAGVAGPECEHDWVRDGHIARCAKDGCEFVRAPQGDERALTEAELADIQS